MTAKSSPTVLPEPPYYAVVFAAVRTETDPDYDTTLMRMLTLVAEQPGFLGFDNAGGGSSGALGITVAYFQDAGAITAWRDHPEHKVAQQSGKASWFDSYAIHIARVERAYRFDRDEATR